MLLQNESLWDLLDKKDGEKAEIQERLRKSIQLYEQFLKRSGR